jgi:hypothetical protein
VDVPLGVASLLVAAAAANADDAVKNEITTVAARIDNFMGASIIWEATEIRIFCSRLSGRANLDERSAQPM